MWPEGWSPATARVRRPLRTAAGGPARTGSRPCAARSAPRGAAGPLPVPRIVRWNLYFARSKSIALYARSFDSRWEESILRIVPDLDRITRDSVVAVSAR